jgi:hypothetical protein
MEWECADWLGNPQIVARPTVAAGIREGRRGPRQRQGPQVCATAIWSRGVGCVTWWLLRRDGLRGDGGRGRCARDARPFRARRRRDVSPLPCDGVPRVRDAPPLSGDALPLLSTSGSPSCVKLREPRVYGSASPVGREPTRLRAGSTVSYCTRDHLPNARENGTTRNSGGTTTHGHDGG